MLERILFVDDERNILEAMQRSLRKLYQVVVAESGKEGIEKLYNEGPFAVVVADMHMPLMDGVEFLRKVKEISPDSVRVMLTGDTDSSTATHAVNEGNIFRFLIKPVLANELIPVLQSAVGQHHLITAEKELLEKTLQGTIRLLTDIMSLVNSMVFSKSTRIVRYVRHIVSKMKLEDSWQYEIAAMLSQIGCITLPPEVINKMQSESELTEKEKEQIHNHPAIGRKLLQNIPRLQTVSLIIANQYKDYHDFEKTSSPVLHYIQTGAQILRVTNDYDFHFMQGKSKENILKYFKDNPTIYNPLIVSALASMEFESLKYIVRNINVKDITPFMVTEEDIRAKNGVTIVTREQEITPLMIEYLRSFAEGIGVHEPFRVKIPV